MFIASIAYDSPTIGNAMYCASKGAVISYANCLALELAPRLIRVNCILPAMIWTDLIYKGGITEEELKEDRKEISSQAAMENRKMLPICPFIYCQMLPHG